MHRRDVSNSFDSSKPLHSLGTWSSDARHQLLLCVLHTYLTIYSMQFIKPSKHDCWTQLAFRKHNLKWNYDVDGVQRLYTYTILIRNGLKIK